MPKISQIDDVPYEAEVRILQKITPKSWEIKRFGVSSLAPLKVTKHSLVGCG